MSAVRSASSAVLPVLPVLHRTAQPIAIHEFADALRAAAPPRFPHGRAVFGRRAGLAISGGVDSMALAYLCAHLRRHDHAACIADAPVLGFTAMIVDHGLREDSSAEAEQVAKALARMGHRHQILRLRWPEELMGGQTADSAAAACPPALETNARRLRYRYLGHQLAQMRIVSLLLAHHEDDQYETVLMRLLTGYGLYGGIRGLRGMRAAADLPECRGLYGAHQSGFLDDQNSAHPYVVMQPSRRERRRLKRDLRNEIDFAVLAAEIRAGGGRWDGEAENAVQQDGGRRLPPQLAPLDTEDLGIMAYRPLLPFAKDRLVATCLANGVPWFEDHTNSDPTLTMRNALRHLARHHELPAALQKPAILQLAARCDATARQHEAEARRLIVRHGIVVRFMPNVGTIVARLPHLQASSRRRPWASSSSFYYGQAMMEKRRVHLRTVAALVVQNLLSFVTPEANVTAVSQLQAVVDTLFPGLVDPATAVPATEPKAFIICGVHFMPLKLPSSPSPGHRTWHLARAPYMSTERVGAATASSLHSSPPSPNFSPAASPSIPLIQFPPLSLAFRWGKPASEWPWSGWSRWNLYDGRFWIRTRTRLPVSISIQPFNAEHSKSFREALAAGATTPLETDVGQAVNPSRDAGPDEASLKSKPKTASLATFLATLKEYAPGKVRYTLPAVYVTSDIGWALRNSPYWPDELTALYEKAYVLQSGRPSGTTTSDVASALDEYKSALFAWERGLRLAERASWPAPDRPAQRLLALPTVGAHVPGLQNWVQCEVRYRKVDTALLDASLDVAGSR